MTSVGDPISWHLDSRKAISPSLLWHFSSRQPHEMLFTLRWTLMTMSRSRNVSEDKNKNGRQKKKKQDTVSWERLLSTLSNKGEGDKSFQAADKENSLVNIFLRAGWGRWGQCTEWTTR